MSTVEIGRDAQNNPIELEYDDTLSLKNFTGWDLVDRNIDITGKVIYATSFLQEKPDSQIFLPATVNVTFVNCNLDNVVIPANCVVIGGSTLRYKVQNDGRDWIIDNNNRPVKLVNEDYYLSLGESIDPADIPSEEAY